MDWIIENWDAIAKIIVGIAVLVMGLPKAKEWRAKADAVVDENNMGKIRSVTLGVVAQIYSDTVREAKASKDGFSDTLKKQVFYLAVKRITEAAKKEGLPIIKDQIPALVEWAVNKLKGDSPKNVLSALLPGSLPVSQRTPSPVEPDLDALDSASEMVDGV